MENNNTEPEYVRAKKGDMVQAFTRETWDMLPGKNHQGWEEIVEEPDELKQKGPTAEEIALTGMSAEYQTVLGFAPGPNLTLADMQTHIEEKRAEIQANAEKSLQEEKDKAEADRLKDAEDQKLALSTPKTPEVPKSPTVKKVGGRPAKPKTDEGTGSGAPTPDDLLKKITNQGGEA